MLGAISRDGSKPDQTIDDILSQYLSEDQFLYISLRLRGAEKSTVTLLTPRFVPKKGSAIDGILNGIRWTRFDDRKPQRQARLYEAYASKVRTQVRKMNNHLRQFRQGAIVRYVFDVESGAFYYRELQNQLWLFGVTANQFFTANEHGVDKGDLAMVQMAEEIEKHLRKVR